MGCSSSKDDKLQTVDDSVHVMLKHDKKVLQTKGEAPHGYVPRAPHPLLQPKGVVVATEDGADDAVDAALAADGAASGGGTAATSES